MAWLHRVINTVRTGRLRRDLDREQAFHLAERTDQLRADGLAADEARRRARVQYGSPAAEIERTRDVDVSATVDAALRNVRYAFRALRRTPGFTLTVVLTLALGIGANSAVFSAIDAVLLKPLPFPEAGQLVRLQQADPELGQSGIAAARLLDWTRAASFAAMTGFVSEDVSDTTGDVPQRVHRTTVLPGFFDVWRVYPALGRAFTDAEFLSSGPDVAVISHRYWQGRLGGRPDVLSHDIRMSGRPYRIVGVMPRDFAFLEETDWWVPDTIDAPWTQARQFRSTIGIGRLKPGATPAQALSGLRAVQAELARQYPRTDATLRPVVEPLKDTIVDASRSSLWVLFGAVSILLLIACSNIAALLLSRGTQRAQEVAVRFALGATRRTVATQLLTEAAVLVVIGGAAGLGVASLAATALQRLAPDVPRLAQAGIDGRILLYTSACVLLVTLLCGLVPALRSSRGEALPRTAGARTHGRHRMQWLLAGVQVALAVTLLAGAGLLLRSATLLGQVDPGFDPSPVLAFRISASFGEQPGYDGTVRRINATMDALRELPGVRATATTAELPAAGSFTNDLTIVETGTTLTADFRGVSPSYFDTMGIPVTRGELCRRPADTRDQIGVMVNQSFADRYLRGRDPIGMHLKVGQGSNRIAGIVGDARERALHLAPQPVVYQCFGAPTPFPFFLLRTAGDPAAMADAVRRKVRALEPLRSVYDIAPLGAQLAGANAGQRLRTTVLLAFAVSALLLSCLGIYGTVSYITRLQRRDVGLRLALGAARSSILRLFIIQGLNVAAVASVVGLALSFALTRTLSGMLYGVTPSDPATLSAVVAIVLAVAAVAALIPAARAALTSPMRTLRED